MHATLIRRQLGGLVPPKIATPNLVSSGSGAGLGPLVDFYSKLPKGQATSHVRGLKGRFFDGKNASGAPLVGLIAGLFLIGYTIDYNMHLSTSFHGDNMTIVLTLFNRIPQKPRALVGSTLQFLVAVCNTLYLWKFERLKEL